jgi:hypothetical protein
MRTIVLIEPSGFDGEQFEVKLEDTPIPIAVKKPFPFVCDTAALPGWDTANAVRIYGQKLLQNLRQSHPGLDQVLQANLTQVAAPAKRPLYFMTAVAETEQLYWETLCDAGGQFLALDSRWPIARMANPQTANLKTTFDFTPPLRLMAVLSAINNPAEPEWRRLFEAVENAHRAGLAMDLLVLVGEQALLTEIRQKRDALQAAPGGPSLRVEAIPGTPIELVQDVQAFKPHVLHFFCHGRIAAGVRQLELARITDWDPADVAARKSSVVLSLSELTAIPALQDLWLVTLNCCEGGRAADNVHSLTQALVTSGVPAAVGMLEPIDARDAHEFCKMFYPAIFETIRTRVETGLAHDRLEEIDWAESLYYPRAALVARHDNDPVAHRQWALPVLYTRRERFQIRPLRAPVPPPERLHNETVAGLLRTIGAETSADAERMKTLLRELLTATAPAVP